MNTTTTYSEFETLKRLYREETKRLYVALLHGATGQQLHNQKELVAHLSFLIDRR